MKASEIDYSKYILPAALVVGGYFVLKQFGLFGGGAAAANANSITSAGAAGTAAAIAADKSAGGIATITAAQAAGIANSIFNAGEDQDTIVRQVIQANTLQDLLLIIQAFGTKQAGGAMCSIFGGFLSATCGTYDLPSWVRAQLDGAHLATLNGYLSDQGINYNF